MEAVHFGGKGQREKLGEQLTPGPVVAM